MDINYNPSISWRLAYKELVQRLHAVEEMFRNVWSSSNFNTILNLKKLSEYHNIGVIIPLANLPTLITLGSTALTSAPKNLIVGYYSKDEKYEVWFIINSKCLVLDINIKKKIITIDRKTIIDSEYEPFMSYQSDINLGTNYDRLINDILRYLIYLEPIKAKAFYLTDHSQFEVPIFNTIRELNYDYYILRHSMYNKKYSRSEIVKLATLLGIPSSFMETKSKLIKKILNYKVQ